MSSSEHGESENNGYSNVDEHDGGLPPSSHVLGLQTDSGIMPKATQVSKSEFPQQNLLKAFERSIGEGGEPNSVRHHSKEALNTSSCDHWSDRINKFLAAKDGKHS